MCGICGITGEGGHRVIEKMTAVLQHRGPDDGGVYCAPAVAGVAALALGHRRLSILDLSARGHQPMTNEDGTIWITFNGEIYNYRELRNELDQTRHRFESETDTEVILHLYEERGTEAFRLLNGIFAFSLYDAREQQLYLVRDHFGIKPLYYTESNGRLIFGSEIKAILASDYYIPDVNWQGVQDFFSYLFIPSPETIFQNIYQVPAAHWLQYDLSRRQFSKRECYWSVADWGKQYHRNVPTESELREELQVLMNNAIGRQMISDVPLGAFLSGGVDSNIIVGLMSRHSTRAVKTYTVRFEGEGMEYYDECREAQRISEKFATDHHELQVDLSQPEEMLDLVEYFDQPFGNTTFYLTWLLSKYTRQSVTVALSGVGGDELFGGYPRYRAVQAARYLKHVPRFATRAAYAALSQIKDSYTDRRWHRIRALLSGLDSDMAQQYLKWVYYLDEERKTKLFGRKASDLLPAHRILQAHLNRIPQTWDEGNRFSWLDVETFLADNLLEYSDKMSMACALELRVPYLDPRVVELAFRIPFTMKLRGGDGKAILREAFADLIPPANRKMEKRGFNIPLGAWMRTRLDKFFDERLPRRYVEGEGIFTYDYLTHLRNEHRQGKRDNAYELLAVLMFDTWYQKYITKTLPVLHTASAVSFRKEGTAMTAKQ